MLDYHFDIETALDRGDETPHTAWATDMPQAIRPASEPYPDVVVTLVLWAIMGVTAGLTLLIGMAGAAPRGRG